MFPVGLGKQFETGEKEAPAVVKLAATLRDSSTIAKWCYAALPVPDSADGRGSTMANQDRCC